MTHVSTRDLIAAATTMIALLTSSVSIAFAAEVDEPEDATVYVGGRVVDYAQPEATGKNAKPITEEKPTKEDETKPRLLGIYIPPHIPYESLQASCVGGSMFVLLDGKKHVFWGARITELDEDSPLRKIGMAEGDVLTRLDGVTLDVDKRKELGIWFMPELNRHYGPTEVRWIKQGSHKVNVNEVDLGEPPPEELTSLDGVFTVRLLAGFKHVLDADGDRSVGNFVHADGRTFQYHIAVRDETAALPNPPYVNEAMQLAQRDGLTLKVQTIGEEAFYLVQLADKLIVSTQTPVFGINMICQATTPAEVTDAILTALSLTELPSLPPPTAPDGNP